MARKEKINPNELRTRDYLMVRIICGVTKTAIHTDRRKAQSRKACRDKQTWMRERE